MVDRSLDNGVMVYDSVDTDDAYECRDHRNVDMVLAEHRNVDKHVIVLYTSRHNWGTFFCGRHVKSA